jgi:hypothetical protein
MYHQKPPTGYLLPDDTEQAHIKITRQTDNKHLGISFIYSLHAGLIGKYSFLEHTK